MSSHFSEAYALAVGELKKNDRQWAAFESTGNCVVLAGPGSGKTKVLTAKVARMLVEDIRPPRGLACLTYNNECVRELERRLGRLGVEQRPNLLIGTVHSFCLGCVLEPFGQLAGLSPPYRIASQDQQESFLQRAVDEIVSTSERASKFRTDLEKHRRTALDRSSPAWKRQIGRLALRYEELLEENGLLDFDGIILSALDLLKLDWVCKALVARFPVVVVDEYQDLGQPLHEVVLRLIAHGARVFVVGDPDQSIYGFTGARPELLIELSERSDVEPVTLRLNYRCGQRIVKAASLTLSEERDYQAGNDYEGAVYFHSVTGATRGQAEHVLKELLPAARKRHPGSPLNEVAILYHNKGDGSTIAEVADAAGIDYVRVDGDAPYRKTLLTRWLEDCAAWCSDGWSTGEPRLGTILKRWVYWHRLGSGAHLPVLRAKRRLVSFLYGYREPDALARDWFTALMDAALGEALALPALIEEVREIERLQQAFAPPKGRLCNLTVRGLGGQVGRRDHLNLITLHSVKGREFDIVFMLGCDEGCFKHGEAQSRNLFYVGLTRARHEIHMAYSGYYERYGKRYRLGPAQFMLDLEKRLTDSF